VPTPHDSAPASLPEPGTGSIIVIIATDAPVLADQCRRIAQRATIGIGRSGGGTSDSSGDIFLAFSTANHASPEYFLPGEAASGFTDVRAIPHDDLTPLFAAAAEATEEAILNALLAGDDMTGRDGLTAHGLTAQMLRQAYSAASEDLRRTARKLKSR
jgi:D-aminopeptidase